MWHGSYYSAIWSNGETGQLTLKSGNNADLQVQRTDTAGPFAGLNVSYTGKWDGTQVTDGKLTFTFKGTPGAGVWTGVSEATPVVHSSVGAIVTTEQRELSYFEPPNAPYINWFPSDLSGFAIHSHGVAGSNVIATHIEDYRARGERPMKMGERRPITLKAASIQPNYDRGATYRYGEAIAAIYADGTTFGDATVLAAMIDRRRSMIAALTGIGTTLCSLGLQQEPIAEVGTALDNQRASEDARSPADKDARDAAYSLISNYLGGHDNSRLPANKAIQRTFDQLNKIRSGLADPVKDNTGKLVIPPVTPPTCGLQ